MRIVTAAALAAFITLPGSGTAEVPHLSKAMYAILANEVRVKHGINAPVALHAAQIHQESRWRPGAMSPVGASGLAQFMPATAKWMPEVDNSLAGVDPLDPLWSIRAQVAYTKWLYDRVDAVDECHKWAFVLSAYNGGIGWVYRDKQLSEDPYRWWGSVAENSDRAGWAYKENREYVDKILFRWQGLYLDAGFDGPEVCKGGV